MWMMVILVIMREGMMGRKTMVIILVCVLRHSDASLERQLRGLSEVYL